MSLQIQKGILQLCKGLVFLHTSARMIHSNLDPESVIINSAVCCRLPFILHVSSRNNIGRLEGLRSRFDHPTHGSERESNALGVSHL
jgi:hypothetical protein